MGALAEPSGGSPLAFDGVPSYSADVLSGEWRRRRTIAEVVAELDLVAEDAASGFCGAVVATSKQGVTLQDGRGRTRVFPWSPAGFLIDGVPTTLTRPVAVAGPAARIRTASGSFAVPGAPARVAQASRIWVEGDHDAALVERIWGSDLRAEGIVVEPIRGLDELAALVAEFGPAPTRKLGVLADHLVPGSKESRIAAQVKSPHVRITGHPYVDIWQAVKPSSLGIAAWPVVPRGINWKEGVAQALGYSDHREVWRRALGSVKSYTDIEVPLLRAVEELIDFVATH
jgi:hypothetical protein